MPITAEMTSSETRSIWPVRGSVPPVRPKIDITTPSTTSTATLVATNSRIRIMGVGSRLLRGSSGGGAGNASQWLSKKVLKPGAGAPIPLSERISPSSLESVHSAGASAPRPPLFPPPAASESTRCSPRGSFMPRLPRSMR